MPNDPSISPRPLPSSAGRPIRLAPMTTVARAAAIASASFLSLEWSTPAARASEAGAPSQPERTADAPHPLRVAVTVAPLAGLVKELVPDDTQITTLLAPGKSEHGFEFTPRELGALGRADLIVYVGLGLEPQVDRFLARNTRGPRQIVEMARVLGIATPEPTKLDEHGHPVDAHDGPHDHAASPDKNEEDADHHHHAIDQHLWLDPVLVERLIPDLAKSIEQATTRPGGGLGGALATRVEALQKKIAAVDQEYATRLAPFKGQSIVTHHAAFGRIAERYGLKVAVVIRPIESAEPTPGQIAEVVAAIKAQHVKAIFVEPQFNAAAAERIAAAAGVRVGTLDPLGDGDWFKMMRSNLDELVDKLGAQ